MMINKESDFSVIMIALSKALDSTAKELVEKLKDYIQSDVYDAYAPIWYDRTYEFLTSWVNDSPTIKGFTVETEISQDYKKLSDGGWTHGSPYTKPQNKLLPNVLAEIINEDLASTYFGFPQSPHNKGFWDKFEKYVNENFEETFIKWCIFYKLPVTKGFIK